MNSLNKIHFLIQKYFWKKFLFYNSDDNKALFTLEEHLETDLELYVRSFVGLSFQYAHKFKNSQKYRSTIITVVIGFEKYDEAKLLLKSFKMPGIAQTSGIVEYKNNLNKAFLEKLTISLESFNKE